MDPEELRKQLKKGVITAAFFALAVLFYALGWRGALVAYVILVGILAVLAILIQSGRGGGLAASLGGLGGDSLLGTHSATPIAKATYVMLALFVFISMLVARMGVAARSGPELVPQGERAPLVSALEDPEGPPPPAEAPAELPEEAAHGVPSETEELSEHD
ncbi:MAG: preprotein translocase subunit SecG [Planctomycetota bacterium]|jgi:preprotein translocase subunit SecG